MKSGFYPLLFLFFFTFPACNKGPGQVETQDRLLDSVFVVHDEVMPKIADINRISRNLKEFAAGADTDSLTALKVTDVLLQLEKADEGMMQWMGDFKQPASLRKSKSHEEIMAYLREEMVKVDKVKTDMLTSIEAGEALLDSLNIKK